jgi:hypothetical protein
MKHNSYRAKYGVPHFTYMTSHSRCSNCADYTKLHNFLPQHQNQFRLLQRTYFVVPLDPTIRLLMQITTGLLFYRRAQAWEMYDRQKDCIHLMIADVIRTAIKETHCIKNVTAVIFMCLQLVSYIAMLLLMLLLLSFKSSSLLLLLSLLSSSSSLLSSSSLSLLLSSSSLSLLLSSSSLLLFLWQMVEKVSHYRSGIPVEFYVLEHLLVGIEFRAI